MLTKSRKKSFDTGIVIPVKLKRCNECKDEILCDECNNQVNENKKVEANLSLLKRGVPNQFGHMIPHYRSKFFLKTIFLFRKIAL